MLVVGNLKAWTASGRTPPQLDGFCFVDYHDICATKLAELLPDVVVTTLITARFDVIDVAKRLADCGFRGALRVMTDSLPNPELVRDEVASVAPDLDFDILAKTHLGLDRA